MHGTASAPGDPSSRPRGIRARLTRQVAGIMRAATLLVVLLGITSTLWLKTAEARFGEMLEGFGAALPQQLGASRLNSAPRSLVVNGLNLRLVTATTTESVRAVLDRIEARCRARGGIAAPEHFRSALPSVMSGAFRNDTERGGVLACIDSGRPIALAEVADRLRAVSTTGDLEALGQLRYVLARRHEGKTTLLILWTEGPLPILRAFSQDGDAPGHDPAGIPRPQGSRRILSGSEMGMPYALTVYAVPHGDLNQLLEWYRATLRARSWSVATAGPRCLHVQRNGHDTLISLSTARNGEVLATVSELGD